MLATYAMIARRSAAVTAAVAAVMVAISAAVAGGKGVIGALLGAALVAVFFAISVIAVGAAAKVSPQVMMLTAMGTYIVKILVLLFLVVHYSNTVAFSPRMFGLTALVCILAWSASQVTWSMRLKMAYVEPDGDR
jgi:ATP synthase protein I